MRSELLVPAALLGALLCAVLGGVVAMRVHAWLERSRARALQARGKRGERDAERLLRAHGYRICARQRRTSYAIEVDGAVQAVELVLDFVVERAGETLVAEVKTGEHAPRLSRAETRRQLLEYQLATHTRHVLLVDPEAQDITQVAFPIAADGESQAGLGAAPAVRGTSATAATLRVLAAGTLLVLAVVWWQTR